MPSQTPLEGYFRVSNPQRVETPPFSCSSPSVIYVFCHWLEPVKDKDRCEVSFHRSQRCFWAASRYVTRCSEPPKLSKVFQFSSCDGAAVEINPLEKVTVCLLYWLQSHFKLQLEWESSLWAAHSTEMYAFREELWLFFLATCIYLFILF